MSRRIVFAGGTQTRALAKLYRGEVAGQAGDDVVFIGTGAVGTDAARSTLLLADALVMEVDEDGDAIPAADLPTRADLVRVPNLYADFLWPFAGGAHPKNRGAFALPGGPYPAEHGDRFLDKMVADGVGEAAAIRRYLAVNMVVDGELDSRLADRLAIQQRLDRAGGYDLAGYIGDRFRTEKLFNTRQRITMPLLRRLVAQLFPKLGVRGYNVEGLRRVPFPAGEQPVHPGVIAHFGLAWAGPGQRYRVNEEGAFTFEEFCGRYMRFAWNEALHRGIQTAKTKPAEAVADLEQGLAESPESPLGRAALEVARHAAGLSDVAPPPDLVIDEDSYDPAALAVDQTPAEPAPPVAEPAPAPEPVPAAAAPEPAVAAPEPEIAAPAVPPPAAPAVAIAPEIEAAPPIAPEPEAEPEPPRMTRFPAPAKPATLPPDNEPPPLAPGFTDFSPKKPEPEPEPRDAATIASPGDDLIDVLPRLLPVFRDLSAATDRPFDMMPEVMPPPPLRPILPPELQGEAPKQGFLARMLGRKGN